MKRREFGMAPGGRMNLDRAAGRRQAVRFSLAQAKAARERERTDSSTPLRSAQNDGSRETGKDPSTACGGPPPLRAGEALSGGDGFIAALGMTERETDFSRRAE